MKKKEDLKIAPAKFVNLLNKSKLAPFLMVPCSIFKPLSNWLLKNNVEVIFPPNEAHAMGFAVGSYLVYGRPAVIFMQNSGLNNIANCQTSLNLLYKIPAVLFVSWRGEKPEAPEHKIMGESLKEFFRVLRIPYQVLSQNWEAQINKAVKQARVKKVPIALVVREGFFQEEESRIPDLTKDYPLSRFQAIKIIKEALMDKAIFVSTNGHPSRESFAVRPSPDFYMMGSMGHAFSVGAGTAWSMARKNSKVKVVVLDGDGGCLMHLGSLALVSLKRLQNSNLIYVVLDNEAYESTGNQPTLSSGIDFSEIAQGLGFLQVFSVTNEKALKKVIGGLKSNTASFIHVKVNRQRTETSRVSDHYTCPKIVSRLKRRVKELTQLININ